MEDLTHQEIRKKLEAVFPYDDLEFRPSHVVAGKEGRNPSALILAYITSRAVMNRLDDVVGPANWTDHYERWGDDGVKATLSIRFGDEWISKQDAADETDIEATKGGISNALKRVAVKWGIGRYLYNLPDLWVEIETERPDRSVIHEYAFVRDKELKISGWYLKPKLPEWALPEEDRAKHGMSSAKSRKPSQNKPSEAPKNQNTGKDMASSSASPTEPKKAVSGDSNTPAAPKLLKAIQNATNILQNKGGEKVELAAIIKEVCDKDKLEDLTGPEAVKVLNCLNERLSNLNSGG